MQRDGALKFASLLLERLKQLSKYLNTNERNFTTHRSSFLNFSLGGNEFRILGLLNKCLQ